MPDITKCSNESCPLKESCYRWTSKPSEFQQSYAKFDYYIEYDLKTAKHVPGCDDFMEIRNNE